MKVLKNNYPETLEKQALENIEVECENCGSILSVNNKDTHIGWLGMEYVTCPCCNKDTSVEEFEGITVTAKNVNFPTHFLYTDKEQRWVVHIEDENINKNIKEGIEYFRLNKDEYYWFTQSGDAIVIMFRYEGDSMYSVYVSRSFYEGDIELEGEDYK